jgi:hypothetical protein
MLGTLAVMGLLERHTKDDGGARVRTLVPFSDSVAAREEEACGVMRRL